MDKFGESFQHFIIYIPLLTVVSRKIQNTTVEKNSKIPNGQTEIVKSEDRQDRGQHKRNEKRT